MVHWSLGNTLPPWYSTGLKNVFIYAHNQGLGLSFFSFSQLYLMGKSYKRPEITFQPLSILLTPSHAFLHCSRRCTARGLHLFPCIRRSITAPNTEKEIAEGNGNLVGPDRRYDRREDRDQVQTSAIPNVYHMNIHFSIWFWFLRILIYNYGQISASQFRNILPAKAFLH